MYMDKEKEKKELLAVQADLANYLYNNYVLYTVDEKKEQEIFKEFNKGNGSLSESQYFEKLDALKEYSKINKVEFTKFVVTPMNTVRVYFVINDVYKEDIFLDKVSAETNKLMYTVSTHSGDGPYYIEEKPEKTAKIMPEEDIVYYEGVIK